MYPLNTNLDLFFMILPFSFSLFLNTDLVPFTFLFLGLGTSCHVSLFSMVFSSSFMAFTQLSFVLSWQKFLGSIIKISATSTQGVCLLLVCTLGLTFAIIWLSVWFFCTFMDGVFVDSGSSPLSLVSYSSRSYDSWICLARVSISYSIFLIDHYSLFLD